MNLDQLFECVTFPRKLSQNLTFFGGSFNPIHQGHLACIHLWKEYHKSKKADLILIPDINPWKNNQLLTKDQRSEILQKITNFIPNDIYLYDSFLFKDEKNPTINWLKPLKSKFYETKLSLLIGFDSFSSIHKWKEASDLLNLLTSLFIVSRNDDPKRKQEQIQNLKKNHPHLQLIFLGHHPHEDISSTKLRAKMTK